MTVSQPNVIQSVLDFLRRHAPFNQMGAAPLEFLAKRLHLVFFAKGEVITDGSDGPASKLFIIKQGRVRGETASGSDDAWELVTGESFPIGALLARRPVHTVHRAAEDTFCFELDRDSFDKLLQQSPVFQDFCTRRIANLLDQALLKFQAASASEVTEDNSLGAPLHTIIQRAPVTCGPETPIQQALQTMEAEHISSLAICDAEQHPIGIITLHDVLSRVVLKNLPLSTPITEVMTPAPLTLPRDATAYEAALLMAQHGFGHICVEEQGKLIGVMSERDLFSLQRVGLVQLSRAITHADGIASLTVLSKEVPRLINQMLAQGASAEQLMQIVTALNDRITERVITLCMAELGKPAIPFTWLSFGSEGRYEQTLKTDQDNGILFIPTAGQSAEEVRATLLPLAQRINQALAECGFTLCPGNIMAGNPECCLSDKEWQARFERWIDQGTPEHLLSATIYFDFRPLYGDPEPAKALRAWLNERIAQNSRFRRQMAENALGNRPPLGLIRDFKLSSGGDHPHTLNLKFQGLAPFVDAARLLALANRINETNTSARLRAAAANEAANPADTAAWIEAYHYIQMLRMRHHQEQMRSGTEPDNHIDPDQLNELDRRILKEAFRQARKLQAKLALEYQL